MASSPLTWSGGKLTLEVLRMAGPHRGCRVIVTGPSWSKTLGAQAQTPVLRLPGVTRDRLRLREFCGSVRLAAPVLVTAPSVYTGPFFDTAVCRRKLVGTLTPTRFANAPAAL